VHNKTWLGRNSFSRWDDRKSWQTESKNYFVYEWVKGRNISRWEKNKNEM